jgi:hypothetical protein
MMPLLSWLCCGSNTPSVISPPTCGSAAGTLTTCTNTAPLWQQQGMAPPVATSTANAVYIATQQRLYLSNQTASAASAMMLSNQTGATNSVFWFDASQDQWIEQEAWVTHEQYFTLARRRVAYTEEQLAQIARAQEEQRRQAEELQLQWHREHAAHEEQRKAAYAKSRELLLAHLTPAQRRTFEENQWFVVQGGKSKKTYRIRTTGYTGNIEEMRGDRATYRLCGHLSGAYALHDHHVAQKISLEYDEEAFVRLCNRHAA